MKNKPSIKLYAVSLVLGSLSAMLLIAALVSYLLSGSGLVSYQSSGTVCLNESEFADFKECISTQPINDINDIAVLDYGDPVVVQFQDLVVNSDFPYGEIEVIEGHLSGSDAEGRLKAALVLSLGMLFTAFVANWLSGAAGQNSRSSFRN